MKKKITVDKAQENYDGYNIDYDGLFSEVYETIENSPKNAVEFIISIINDYQEVTEKSNNKTLVKRYETRINECYEAIHKIRSICMKENIMKIKPAENIEARTSSYNAILSDLYANSRIMKESTQKPVNVKICANMNVLHRFIIIPE